MIRGLRRPVPLLLVLWFTLFISASAWALATPLGGSPDEPAHLIKAASVVRGELLGGPTSQGAVRVVQVPVGIAGSAEWPCFAFDSQEPASCLSEVEDGSTLVSAETSAGLYNPVYYMLVGWPSLITGNTSVAVLGMRLASAFLVTFFLAAAFLGLRRLNINIVTAVGFLAAATPMVLFLAGAVNPNAFEVATGLALLTSLLALLSREPQTNPLPWLLLAGGAGALFAQARGLSPLWMAMIAVIVLVVTPWSRVRRELRRWPVVATVAVLGSAAGAALAWTLMTGSLNSMGQFPGATDAPPLAFFTMLLRGFDPGLIGYFGWLDTPSPSFVYALWSFLAFAMVTVALAVGGRREVWAVLVAVSGVVVIPAVVQAVSVNSSGYIWQGRYGLVAYVCLVALATSITASIAARSRVPAWTERWVRMIGSLVVLGHVWAMFAALQRYQGGVSIWDVFIAPLWTPPGGILLWLLVVAVGCTGTFVVSLLASESDARGDERVGEITDGDPVKAGRSDPSRPEKSNSGSR